MNPGLKVKIFLKIPYPVNHKLKTQDHAPQIYKKFLKTKNLFKKTKIYNPEKII